MAAPNLELSGVLMSVALVLAILSGRSLARRVHDVRLLRSQGIRVRVLALPVMLELVGFAAANAVLLIVLRLLTLYIALVGVEVSGNVEHLIPPSINILLLYVSYLLFSRKYSRVNHPLTREARALLAVMNALKRGVKRQPK